MDGSGDNVNGAESYKDASATAGRIDGQRLLYLARSAITRYLTEGVLPPDSREDALARTNSGLFVTLWTRAPDQTADASAKPLALRGCIGHLQSRRPLDAFVQEVAVAAATRDPRFLPLTAGELDSIKIEIAILSPLREISSLRQIRIGKDGLFVEGQGRRGLLLPKVATRMGWDQQSFVRGVCQKAGLPDDCWPRLCQLFAFTTADFEENKRDYGT